MNILEQIDSMHARIREEVERHFNKSTETKWRVDVIELSSVAQYKLDAKQDSTHMGTELSFKVQLTNAAELRYLQIRTCTVWVLEDGKLHIDDSSVNVHFGV